MPTFIWFKHSLSNTINFQIYIRTKDGTQTSTTSPGQSAPGSNGNEGLLHSPQSSRFKPHHQTQIIVITRTQFLFDPEMEP